VYAEIEEESGQRQEQKVELQIGAAQWSVKVELR
jgi:hypothetical protein